MGIALQKRNIAGEVVGVCRHESSLIMAKKRKAITYGYRNIDMEEAVKDSDLIVLATPVKQIMEIIPRISSSLKKEVIVTDVGSTKKEIVKQAERFFYQDRYFVGAHPIAGSEKRGVKEAKEDIFENSFCIITPTPRTNRMALKKVCQLWELLGARIKIMSPSAHDRLMAKISHLPHALAVALIVSLEKNIIPFGAGGLRDTTRIASSNPSIWNDIFLTNREEILKAIKKFNKVLGKLSSLISHGDRTALYSFLKNAQKKRALLEG